MIEQAKQAKTPIEYDFQCRTSTLKSFLRGHGEKKWEFSHFDGEISRGRRLKKLCRLCQINGWRITASAVHRFGEFGFKP